MTRKTIEQIQAEGDHRDAERQVTQRSASLSLRDCVGWVVDIQRQGCYKVKSLWQWSLPEPPFQSGD